LCQCALPSVEQLLVQPRSAHGSRNPQHWPPEVRRASSAGEGSCAGGVYRVRFVFVKWFQSGFKQAKPLYEYERIDDEAGRLVMIRRRRRGSDLALARLTWAAEPKQHGGCCQVVVSPKWGFVECLATVLLAQAKLWESEWVKSLTWLARGSNSVTVMFL
jgi:hypothetical protein